MKLKDKVAIITGSGRGIGEGIAREFSREGANVVIAECNEQDGQRIADELGSAEGRAIFVRTDVTVSKSVREMIGTTLKTFGRIDTLVNNAGRHLSKNIEETSEEEWEIIQNTNLRSTFLCSRCAIPHLRKTRGAIVNISSMVGLIGQSNAGAYSASKGGIIAMSKGMAIDFSKDGIRVNVICPGVINTPLAEDWFKQQKDPESARAYLCGRHPLGRIGTIEDCGRAAVFLACEDSSFITGVCLNVDGGLTLGY